MEQHAVSTDSDSDSTGQCDEENRDSDSTGQCDEENRDSDSTGQCDEENSDFNLEDTLLPEEVLQQKSYDFLSKMKSEGFSTQTSLDEIVKGVDGLIQQYNQFLEARLLSYQAENLISVSDVKAMFQSLHGQSIFEGIQTKKKQKTYRKCNRTDLDPVPIHTKTKIKVNTKGGFKEVPDVQGCASPFLQVLEVLLQCEDILHCIRNPLKSTDGKIRYLADGFMWQSHPVLLEDPCAIVIIGYGDDVQPGDGLSSKSSGHMLRSFTWTLGNIYPWFHSSLKCINTLSIMDKGKMDEGNGPALKDFIDGINQLSTTGVTFNIKGQPTKFRGCLLFVCGDTPASGNFAGMKESPSAFSPCRICMVNEDTIFQTFTEVGSLLRNSKLHKSHLEALASPASGTVDTDSNVHEDSDEESIEGTKPKDPSVLFGVNSRSCFMDVKYFDVTKGFPLDIMHIFAESGVLEVNVRLLLKNAITQRKVTLKQINSFISSFDYGPLKKDKPGKIKAEHLNNNLRQTASQMFLLAHLVPFILDGKCNSAELKNYIRLLMIVNISLAHVVDEDEDLVTLRNLIENYLTQLRVLYGEIHTLKMHFLVHLPSQILLYGVLTLQWCMRFEAFHSILKRLYKIMHNSINVPVSLTERVLERFVHQVDTCPPGKFLYSGHTGQMEPAVPLGGLEWQTDIKTAMPELKNEDELIPVQNLGYHGFVFSKDAIILLDNFTHQVLPKFGTVFKIFLFKDIPILLCRSLETICYDVKLNAYKVKCENPQTTAVCMKESQFIRPLLGIQHDGHSYILLMHNSNVRHSEVTNWNVEDISISKSKSRKRARK